MMTKPPKTPHDRPPPSGAEGRGYVSPLGGQTSGSQTLSGGSGVMPRADPMKKQGEGQPGFFAGKPALGQLASKLARRGRGR